jgi:hypothetical protein
MENKIRSLKKNTGSQFPGAEVLRPVRSLIGMEANLFEAEFF